MRGAPLAVLLALTLAGCDLGGDGDESAVDKAQFVVEFVDPSQEFVGPVARAGLSAESANRTRIVIEVEDPPAPRQRAEIRPGSCDGPIISSVEYLLNDVEDGKSTTILVVPLKELRRGVQGHVIRLHDDPFGTEFGGACGDLTSAEEQ